MDTRVGFGHWHRESGALPGRVFNGELSAEQMLLMRATLSVCQEGQVVWVDVCLCGVRAGLDIHTPPTPPPPQYTHSSYPPRPPEREREREKESTFINNGLKELSSKM